MASERGSQERVRIELERLTRTFGDKRAVDDLSLEIAAGELCVLLGPSGCGKSTTLRCIAGLEPVDGGTIRFNGRVVDDLDPVARDVAMVFQNYALYPHMTVRANVAFPLKMRKVRRAAIDQRVDDVCGALGLTELLDRRPRQLSGGQQQRVALARALVRDPKVFLFDEPLSNLDAKLRVELRGEIKALHRRVGTTMVYVTHDQAEAMVLADRIAVLDRGRLLQHGRPTEVFDRPATRFVASFLGSPPMRICTVTSTGGVARFLGVEFAVPGSEPIRCGIRPHHLQVGSTGPRHVQGRVRNVERLGHESLVDVEVDGHALLAWSEGHVAVEDGQSIELSFDPARIHAFDTTDARLDVP